MRSSRLCSQPPAKANTICLIGAIQNSGVAKKIRESAAAPPSEECPMVEHLMEISASVDPGCHAVLMLDQAGWQSAIAARTRGRLFRKTNPSERRIVCPELSL